MKRRDPFDSFVTEMGPRSLRGGGGRAVPQYKGKTSASAMKTFKVDPKTVTTQKKDLGPTAAALAGAGAAAGSEPEKKMKATLSVKHYQSGKDWDPED